jgi:transcriptional regulator with XRE-family HTH domain
MTQGDLAKVVHVSPARVSEWVRAKAVPNVAQLVDLSVALETDLLELILGSTSPSERHVVEELAKLAPPLQQLAAEAEQLAYRSAAAASKRPQP